MESQLSDLYARCYSSFETLLVALDAQKRDIEGQISREEVVIELDRFKLWARSVGAKHSGAKYKYSLDYRLRKAPFYRDRVCTSISYPRDLY